MLKPGSNFPILLASKFFRPSLPPTLVKRAQLIERLNEGLAAGRPLTLVSAPAGYGKSTLAAEWLKHVQHPVAWLSLDEADDQPLRFFAYFCSALQAAGADLGEDLPAALAAGHLPAQDVLLGALVNGLAALERTSLCVLDDFQVIQDKTILDVLQGLLASPLPTLHLVLVTREDPALPLARLRGHNQLTEVRAADLRFRGDEVESFLCRKMGLSLSEGELARLTEQTEGWIAGLQLAGLAMRSPQGQEEKRPSEFVASLSGTHRFILSYLTDEVLKTQPPAIQEFLLDTSILSRLTGDLCDAVTGSSGSSARLESLLSANLFLIPLDDEGVWYRYHHLFADLLKNQLRQKDAEHIAELHERASRWYEAQDMPLEAVDHALAASDFTRVMSLLEKHGMNLIIQGYARKMQSWLKAIPSEMHSHSPRTNLGFAWMHLLRGSFQQVVPYLSQAQAAVARLDPEAPETRDLTAECLALQANLMQVQGNIPGSLEAARSALEAASPDHLRVFGLASLALGASYRLLANFEQASAALQDAIQAGRATGDRVTEMLAVSHLVLMSLQHGKLRFAARVAEESLAGLPGRAAAPPPIIGSVYGGLGLIFYEWNQVEAAYRYFQEGVRLSAFSGHNASLIYTKAHLARLYQGQGDLDAARQMVEEAGSVLKQGAPGWVRSEWIAQQVSLLVAQGDLYSAEAHLQGSGVHPEEDINHLNDAVYLAWLRLMYVSGDGRALSLAKRILDSAVEGGRNGTALQALILGALIQSSDSPASHAWLRRALTLAEPEGYLRTFIDEGTRMAALLRQVGETIILAHFPVTPIISLGEGELIDALSEREMEVLQLLAQGLKYAEIAEQLVVSINTVRYHVKGIYGKLGVDRLPKAIEQARKLGLL